MGFVMLKKKLKARFFTIYQNTTTSNTLFRNALALKIYKRDFCTSDTAKIAKILF